MTQMLSCHIAERQLNQVRNARVAVVSARYPERAFV